MNHIYKYNEEAIWNHYKKKDMYKLSSWILGKLSDSEKHKENTFYIKAVPNLKPTSALYFKKRYLIEGIFIKGNNRYYTSYYITTNASGCLWYDVSEVFYKLRKISDKLGYKLGAKVNVLPENKIKKIVEIINFAFIEESSSTPSQKYTLLYRTEGEDIFYQITQIELIIKESKE